MNIKFRGGLLGLKDFLVLLKLLLLVMVYTSGEVQGKYSKWLILLMQKLRLLVKVTATQEVQGKYTKSDVLRTAESDSDNKEEYEIKRNKFGAPTYGLKPAAYMNCNGPAERSLALQTVINPLRKISVWKKAVSFLGSLPMQLQHVDWKPDYKGCYTNEEEAKG
ncbi:hypothetical protein Tco_0233015 [Tanacetum coccineum]